MGLRAQLVSRHQEVAHALLEIPEAETVVLGTTGTPMDSQSFQIVGAGAEEKCKWAFMKNMGMPGSIAAEISAQIRPAAAAR